MIALLLSAINPILSKLKIVTTTSDLSNLTKIIGGNKVKVTSLTKGNQDTHYIEPRPSMVMKLKNASLLICIGMDLDSWVQSLINISGNTNVMYGGTGYLDVSLNIKKLEVPRNKIDARSGDIHIYGNPHFWIDPYNVKIILKDILNKLTRLSPKSLKYFNKNYELYLEKLNTRIKKWQKKMLLCKNKKIIAFHNSWPYLAKRYNLEIVDFVETKPGIPPKAAHIISLIKKIKRQKIKVLIVGSYFSLSIPNSIARATGIKVISLPLSSGGIKNLNSYLKLMDYIINKLSDALM